MEKDLDARIDSIEKKIYMFAGGLAVLIAIAEFVAKFYII